MQPLARRKKAKRSKLGLLPLVALIFYEVSGGPFGTEVRPRPQTACRLAPALLSPLCAWLICGHCYLHVAVRRREALSQKLADCCVRTRSAHRISPLAFSSSQGFASRILQQARPACCSRCALSSHLPCMQHP